MLRGLRFWLKDQPDQPDYFQEALNAGWVPQLPAQAFEAAARALETVTPALSSLPEAEVRDLIARLYLNQAC